MINKKELPKNWEMKKLSEIADKITDGTHHTPTYIEQGIPFISVKDIRSQKVHFDHCKYISADEHNELIKRCHPEEGDLLITKSGTIGRLAIVPKIDFSLFVSVALIKLQKNKQQINQKWMLYFFEFHIAFLDIKSKIKGGVVKNYHLEDLRQVEIPLPPLAEQERIVAKIEELFSELDAGRESLKTAAHQLKTYRQAVLKWAFEGKLTNENVSEGELPDGWHLVHFGNVVDEFVRGPFGSALKKEFFVPAGYKVYEQKNAIYRTTELGDYFINQKKFDELKRFEVKGDDYIVSCSGTIGKLFRVPLDSPKGLINQALLIIRINRKLLLDKFFSYLFTSETFQRKIMKDAKGTAMLNLAGVKDMKIVPFLLPPIEEQQRIVEEIESRLSVCEKLEETINQSLAQSESLRQSILKQAFEGKLVNSQ